MWETDIAPALLDYYRRFKQTEQVAAAQPSWDRLEITLILPDPDYIQSPVGRSLWMLELARAARALEKYFPDNWPLIYDVRSCVIDAHRAIRIIYTDMTAEYNERRQLCRAVTLTILGVARAANRSGRMHKDICKVIARLVWETREDEVWPEQERKKDRVAKWPEEED
jgi:hypothetical protein